MAEQDGQHGNRPDYVPCDPVATAPRSDQRTLVGMTGDDPAAASYKRSMQLPPDTTNQGRMAGMGSPASTPEGIGHVADNS